MGEESLAVTADTGGELGEGAIGGDVGEAIWVLVNETGCFILVLD